MLTKRIIPCLDVRDGQTVKGVQFGNLRFAGDPVELGQQYARQGADELVFLDITATIEERDTFAGLVRRIAEHVNIPFTVGGGIRKLQDVDRLLSAGADKITINSAAVARPELIEEMAKRFGSQCVVLAIDAKKTDQGHLVFTHGGREPTKLKVRDWAREAVQRGAGEILLTSMDHDGTKDGFAVELTRKLAGELPIPVIASGGGGKIEHFTEVFRAGRADAALAASIFHFNEIAIDDLKRALKGEGIEVRL